MKRSGALLAIIMVVELTQQDLKNAKESVKSMSREKCREFLDGI